MAHKSKDFDRILDLARKHGCRIQDNGGTVKVFPPNPNIQAYYAHRSERAFHPLRRYLKNQLGITE